MKRDTQSVPHERNPPTPADAEEEIVAQDLTQLLDRVAGGSTGARAELIEVVYARLRAMAARQLQGSANTLQPTALVHEAYMKLFAGADPAWEGRNHFFGAAASAMRQAAVEHARQQGAQKRGGQWSRLTMSGLDLPSGRAGDVDVLELDEALKELSALSERQARIVELRFFAGLEIKEAARVLGVSPRTVELDWRTARAWLRSRLEEAQA